jgi:hypothetical protein
MTYLAKSTYWCHLALQVCMAAMLSSLKSSSPKALANALLLEEGLDTSPKVHSIDDLRYKESPLEQA